MKHWHRNCVVVSQIYTPKSAVVTRGKARNVGVKMTEICEPLLLFFPYNVFSIHRDCR